MARHKKKKLVSPPGQDVELNVMPFIDIFSLLCTFLLFSAVFVTIGILEVQIPFLTNAAPNQDLENKRLLEVKIDVEMERVELATSFTKAPIDENREYYSRDEKGLSEMHSELIELRDNYEETDKVTLFVDDEILYEDLVQVLDQIKLRFPGDPGFNPQESNKGIETTLYTKVVMGSVIL